MKCNVDGSYISSTTPTQAWWIVRDDKRWYQGASQTKGMKTESPMECEIQTLIIAIKHCWSRIFTKIIFENDCKKWIVLIVKCYNLIHTTRFVKQFSGRTNLKLYDFHQHRELFPKRWPKGRFNVSAQSPCLRSRLPTSVSSGVGCSAVLLPRIRWRKKNQKNPLDRSHLQKSHLRGKLALPVQKFQIHLRRPPWLLPMPLSALLLIRLLNSL